MDDEDIQREEPELELDQETLEQQSQESSRPTTSPSAPTVFETKALTADIIASGISLLARTGNGVSHAYTRLDIKNADISDVQILENYNHLRYLVNYINLESFKQQNYRCIKSSSTRVFVIR